MSNVLVLAPHPDDETFGCGGSICHHVDAGDSVRVVWLTNGEAAGDPAVRIQEGMTALQVLGGDHIRWSCARFPDGGLEQYPNFVDALDNFLEGLSEEWDILYAPHQGESHSDHRAVAGAAPWLQSGELKMAHLFSYEVWTPLSCPNVVRDVTRVWERKAAAMQCYNSQPKRFALGITGLARYHAAFKLHTTGFGEALSTI